MLEQQLQNLGLSKNETTVYLSLFELGKSKAGQIIEHTGLHRNLVYTALENLIRQGLIAKVIAGNVAIFEANSPSAILNAIEEKKSLAQEVIEQLKKKQTETPRDINIYDGIEGIKKTRENILREIKNNESYYVMGVSYSNSSPNLSEYFSKFNKNIINKGADLKVLVDRNDKEDIISKRALTLNKNARYLPFNINSPMWLALFRDSINISIIGSEPITFSIRSGEAAEGFRKYFEYFWNQKVTVENGLGVLKNTIYEMLNELKPGEEYLVLGASFGGQTDAVQNLYDQFHTDRIKKGVITKMLVYKESFDLVKNRFYKSGDPFFKVSFIKPFVSAPPIPMQINLYKEKMFIILYDKEPVVLKFDRKDIYEGFKKYFDILWEQKVETYYGEKDVQEVYEDFIKSANSKSEVIIFASKPKSESSANYNVDWAKRLSQKITNIKYIYYGMNEINKNRRNEILQTVPKAEIKILPTEQKQAISTIVMDDIILNTVWDETPVCFKIQNKAVAGSLKDNFYLLWNQETQIIKGPKALQEIWLEIIDHKELRLIGARGYFIDRYPELFKVIEEKAKKTPGIKWKNVVDIGVKGHKITKFPWAETKYNLSTIKNPNVVWLYGKKVIIANWAGNEPIMFVSTNKHLVQSYNDYFEELWNLKK